MTSNIDLIFTLPDVGVLYMWVVDDELIRPSDNEVIVCDPAHLVEETSSMGTSKEFTEKWIRIMFEGSRYKAVGT